jgi:hypothetical protein
MSGPQDIRQAIPGQLATIPRKAAASSASDPETAVKLPSDSIQLVPSAPMARVHTIHRASDPRFQAGFQLIQRTFSADLVDPASVFKEQLADQEHGKLGKNTYRFLTLDETADHAKQPPSAPSIAGVATFNYLAKSNVVFENYFVAKEGLEPHRALLKAMTDVGASDALKTGKQLSAIAVEADAKEVPMKRAQGYLQLEGLDYQQPPLHPGDHPVKLPLMIKVVNPDDPGFVKRNGKVVGVTSDKARAIIQDIYASIYERQASSAGMKPGQYLSTILHSMDGKDMVPLQ